MFISVLELFKIGIGPSSSHTMGPMAAAGDFLARTARADKAQRHTGPTRIRCTLKGSLAATGKGHGTDRAVLLGLHGHTPEELAERDVEKLVTELTAKTALIIGDSADDAREVGFDPENDIFFDRGERLPEHPNGMIFEWQDETGQVLLTETYFSIGGGFIKTLAEISKLIAPLDIAPDISVPHDFDSANSMLAMATDTGLSVAAMKRANELAFISEQALDRGLDALWQAMQTCVDNGLTAEGSLPGGLRLSRRAKSLSEQLHQADKAISVNDWLCAYAMAVNEENAAGHMVVTAPTNGAAGVIPAILYYLIHHEDGTTEQIRDFLLTASAIGSIIKYRSSISGAEVGCQGEVGSAASMAAAGLCAVRGGTPQQIENAAEIALEHHLGMTCDPVGGLVQVPCIERNGFGAIKAYTAASLALRGSGEHFMPLDSCIAAMKQTGLEMSEKFKETSLGGLAVSITEC